MIDVTVDKSPIQNDLPTRIRRALAGLGGIHVTPGDADHLCEVAALLRDLLAERSVLSAAGGCREPR